MDYNTSRNKLVIPEYGRNVQRMIEYAIKLEDREKRTRLANLIVGVMAQLNPTNREQSDYRQKLWDHLHMISNFKLDVDSPYPIPNKDTFNTKPEKLKCYSNGIKYRHYGKHIENLIKSIVELKESPKKDELIKLVANHLKKTYLIWNKDSVSDEAIMAHLKELSDGALQLPEGAVLSRSHELLQKGHHQQGSGRKKGHSQKGGQQSHRSQSSHTTYHRSKRNKRNN